MYNNLTPLLLTVILLTLFPSPNRAHSIDDENELNDTVLKDDRPLLDNEKMGNSGSLGINNSNKVPYENISGDDADFKQRIETNNLTLSSHENNYYGFLNTRYPKMPIYLKKLLQKTHAKLEKKKVVISNLSQMMRNLPQRMERKMKRIFSSQFPFNIRDNDDNEKQHNDDSFLDECCDHDDYMERFEDEMDTFHDYVDDYNDYVKDYIDSLNFSDSNGSQSNTFRIDIVNDHPYTSGSRIIISQSNNGSPFQPQFINGVRHQSGNTMNNE